MGHGQDAGYYRILEDCFGGFMEGVASLVNKNVPKQHQREGRYQFVPLNEREAIQILRQAFEIAPKNLSRRPKFVDCGCGIGNIVMFAHRIGFDACGLEYDRSLVQAGREISYNAACHINIPSRWDGAFRKYDIRKADILTYESYGQFDVIYWYCPLYDRRQEERFEKRVRDYAKVGALIVPVASGISALKNDYRFRPVQQKTEQDWVAYRPDAGIFRKVRK